MSDKMHPIPFGKLMNWIAEEYITENTIFGVSKIFRKEPGQTMTLFGETLETPFGPAAGPHNQLAQNIIAAYTAGARFFELKTVQPIDGDDLPVAKPCIAAPDECYNCEWSTELRVPEAFDEYVKACARSSTSTECATNAATVKRFVLIRALRTKTSSLCSITKRTSATAKTAGSFSPEAGTSEYASTAKYATRS